MRGYGLNIAIRGRCCFGLLLGLLCFSVACDKQVEDSLEFDPSKGLPVFVSVPPHATVVEAIGGDRVSVKSMIGPDKDPHSFSATPQQVLALGKARLYFTTGMPFESKYLPKITETNSGLQVVDLQSGIEILDMAEHDHDHGEEGHEDHHDHGSTDPHIWLGVSQLKVQANTIAAALTKADPDGAAVFAKNLESLQSELDAVEEEVRAKLTPFKGKTFHVFHPALAYFAWDYDMNQSALEVGGNKPSPKQLLAFIERARADGIKVIFIQPQFDQRSAKTVADELQATVATIDPLDPDVLSNLRKIADQLVKAF